MFLNKFDKSKNTFKKVLEIMQKDLQYLVNKGSINEKFIAKQNQIINNLINFYNETEINIYNLTDYNVNTQLSFSREIEKLNNRIEGLEALCILWDIPPSEWGREYIDIEFLIDMILIKQGNYKKFYEKICLKN